MQRIISIHSEIMSKGKDPWEHQLSTMPYEIRHKMPSSPMNTGITDHLTN